MYRRRETLALNRRAFAGAVAGAFLSRLAEAAEVDNDEAIRNILRQRIDTAKQSLGMAVCVVTPNRRRVIAFGRERLNDSRPITPRTVFEIGSVTKVFTAQLLGEMASRGELDLDDAVADHLPGNFSVPSFDGRKITLLDLATHTSALPRFPPLTGVPLSPSWIDAVTRFSTGDFRDWLADLKLPRAPGTVWEYSNVVGYGLLGLALAHRGGRSFDDLLSTRVLKPLGLDDTALHATAAMSSRLAVGHDSNFQPVAPIELGLFGPAGALRSTPIDMARFASAILQRGGSRNSRAFEILLSRGRPAPPITGMQCLGWEMRDAPGGFYVSKDGVTSGQATSTVFDPERRVAILVFSNTSPNMRFSTASGGGVGSADVARHLLRPRIPLNGEAGALY